MLQQESKDRCIVKKIRFSPEDREKNPYHYISFEVPENTRCLELSYDYTNKEAVIDIGLFAPGSIDFLNASVFRGWSGSSKKQLFVCENWATPGYICGPLVPGYWHVILGLYKVPPEGCKVTIRIRFHEKMLERPWEPRIGKESKVSEKLNGQREKWMRGDLHVHTIHSDGDFHPLEIVEEAKKLGLNYIALTDHNTISQNRYSGVLGGVIVLPGEEVTTYKGHMNVIGYKEWVDFRVTNHREILKLHNMLEERNILHYVNHPKPQGPPWEWDHIEKIGGMEVWQGAWRYNNWHSLDIWHRLLSKGSRVLGLGGSDVHKFKEKNPLSRLGNPTTWVLGIPCPKGVLDGIKRGRVVVTETPRGPFINMHVKLRNRTAGIGDTIPAGTIKVYITTWRTNNNLLLRLISGGKVIWVGTPSQKIVKITLNKSDMYLVADLISSEKGDPWKIAGREIQLKAFTNPIYIAQD